MIQEEWLRAICDIFERASAGDKVVWQGEPGESKVAYQVVDGVAIVDLMGPIFPRANLMTRVSGATSSEEFRNNFSRAMDDGDVESVLLRIDSPGGAVSGIFEAASLVYAGRFKKDIVAMCEGTMASAAYLVGSQASAVYATEASVVGSIGVVMQIEDDTRQRMNEGVQTYTLKTGPLKAVGAGPVTDEQIQHMRGLMDDFFGRFKSAVTRGRIGIDIDAVSTGAVWIGKKAEDMGLIDGIMTMDSAMKMLGSGKSLRGAHGSINR
jgi:signal peptide peptidase SppA